MIETDVDRRKFLNRTLLGALSMFSVAFGGGSVAFLWPEVKRGFGSKINADKHADLLAQIKLDKRPVYNVEGKFFIVRYPHSDDPTNTYVRNGLVAGGLMALYQKCSHLGCRVPYCPSSGWFECPCHGARFNAAGEVMNGPAPAGMWRFPISIDESGNVIVDTRTPVAQPPMGTNTVGDLPKGAFCVEC